MLPDPLVTAAGERVTTTAAWPARRAEILELFTHEMFGRAPVARPTEMTITVKETTPGMMKGAAERRMLRIDWKGPGGSGGMNITLFVPTKSAKPAACFLLICNRPLENIDPTREQKSPFWPAENLSARGYATATFWNAEIDGVLPSGLFSLLAGVEAWMPALGHACILVDVHPRLPGELFRSGNPSFNPKPRINNPHSNDNWATRIRRGVR
jgi:hypothetical protein